MTGPDFGTLPEYVITTNGRGNGEQRCLVTSPEQGVPQHARGTHFDSGVLADKLRQYHQGRVLITWVQGDVLDPRRHVE